MIETQPGPSAPHTFGGLPVSSPLARSLAAMGYHEPTPVQEQTIPLLRRGSDVLAQAQTGTGKTAGFGIPLVETIKTQERAVQAIVLVPTRELCLQVAGELSRLADHGGVRVIAVYGGVGLGPQIDALRRGAQVVVGTPGRVEDLLARRALDLGHVRFAVLDEADRMLDVGFLPAIERILSRIPRSRQTALFSATLPAEVRGLAARHMQSPATVEIDPERTTVEEIEQRFERVPDADKLATLCTYLDDPACYLALVFRRTTHRADRLARDLSRRGYKVAAIHGRRSQPQRERALADLRSGKLQALIATDVAARGLDIAGLTHVFNYDLPDTPDAYVHRIGRTGRAGETGTAVTFVTPEDEPTLRAIERHLAGRRNESTALPRRTPSPHSTPGGQRRRGNRNAPPHHDRGRPDGAPRHRGHAPGDSRPRRAS
ncbi:MAG TPA: DEAD/DEAH box helicase [Chloroflexota bacterium]|nr:DEAD/DEAH box helicase [Chloroflexota bacterium]